jgi:Protein of unknown function (DUF2905)
MPSSRNLNLFSILHPSYVGTILISERRELSAYHQAGTKWTKARLAAICRPKVSNCVMVTFLKIFIVVVLVLAFIGWLADRRAAANKPDVTPGLSFLPGDIKYESPNGNVRIYFPIVTSIVLSVLLTLILRLFS